MSHSSEFKRYVWDTDLQKFQFSQQEFAFSLKRHTYARNENVVIVANSHYDQGIVILTNISPTHAYFYEYLQHGMRVYYNYLADYVEWLTNKDRLQDTFHLGIIEEQVIQIEEHYGYLQSEGLLSKA